MAEQLHPALVLMDINMPEMNGIEATRRIVSSHPDVVVVLCSTYEVGDLPPDAATSGARAYINKEHLGADTLRRLWEESGGLLFSVSDDGPGFDVEKAQRGHGYVNMADRLGAIGGTVRWESQPGKGARVTGSVPLI